MCGACGDRRTPHWSDVGDGPRSRPARTAAARGLLAGTRLELRDWQGRWLLADRRGRTAVADHLGALWAEAARLAGSPVDPLAQGAGAPVAPAAPPGTVAEGVEPGGPREWSAFAVVLAALLHVHGQRVDGLRAVVPHRGAGGARATPRVGVAVDAGAVTVHRLGPGSDPVLRAATGALDPALVVAALST